MFPKADLPKWHALQERQSAANERLSASVAAAGELDVLGRRTLQVRGKLLPHLGPVAIYGAADVHEVRQAPGDEHRVLLALLWPQNESIASLTDLPQTLRVSRGHALMEAPRGVADGVVASAAENVFFTAPAKQVRRRGLSRFLPAPKNSHGPGCAWGLPWAVARGGRRKGSESWPWPIGFGELTQGVSPVDPGPASDSHCRRLHRPRLRLLLFRCSSEPQPLLVFDMPCVDPWARHTWAV